MRKHFLLLFLMALLPLAGWAATLEDATIIVADITYGGAAPTVTKVQIGSVVLNEATDYDVEADKYYLDEDCTELVEDGDLNPVPASKLPAGVYYYVKVIGTGSYSNYKGGKFFVNKKEIELTITLPGSFKPVYDGQTYANVAAPTGTTKALSDFAGNTLANSENLNDVLKGSLKISYAATSANKTPGGVAVGTRDAATVTPSGLSADNYEITYAALTVDIYQKAIVNAGGDLVNDITITSTGNTVTYNKEAHAPVFTVKFGETTVTTEFTVTKTSGSDTNAGTATYKVSAKEVSNFSGEYAGKEAAGDLNTYKLTIKKAAAFVKAKKQTRAYNGNTTLTSTNLYAAATDLVWTGLYTGDEITGAPTLNVSEDAKDAGEYTINITAPVAGWTIPNDNYAVGIDNSGIYEISKLDLTVTAKDKTVFFGNAAPTFTVADVDIAGSLNGDELAELKKGISAQFVSTFNYATAAAGEFANVIEPTVDKTQAAATFANYEVIPVKGKLTINAAQILIAIKALEKFYGQPDPDNLSESYTITGSTEGLLTNPVVKRAPGETVGEYLMTIETEATAKPGYEILYLSTPVNFTINKAQLTFTMPQQIIEKNSTVDALSKDEITVEGIFNATDAANPKALYELAFGDDVTVSGGKATADEVVLNGVKATLTTAAQAKYVIITNAEVNPVETDIKIFGKLIVGTGGGAGLDFTSVNTDYDDIVANDGMTQAVTLTIAPRNTREVPAGTVHKWAAKTWNTMVLPFDVSVADLSRALGYAIVNRVDAKNTTTGNVQFKLEMDKIPANEPFCVKTSKAIASDYDIIFPNAVFIEKPASEYPSVDAGQGYKFVGAYKSMTITGETPYYSFLRGDINKWAQLDNPGTTNTWTVVPFDAYIDLTPAGSAARDVTFTFEEIDGSTTTVKAVNAEINNSAMYEGWYTINGIKLQTAPTEKGVYINNGKKIVIK